MVPPVSATLAALLLAVSVPPHVVAPPALAVFTRFAGYVSVKSTPVTAAAFGLVKVIVRTLVSFVPIELGAKDFAAATPPSTESDAFAAAVLAPAFVVVRPPAAMLLLYVPAVALVTLTVTVQLPDAGIVPPESATLLALLFAVTTPPQVVAPLAAAVFTRFAGQVSVKAAPVIAAAFGFVSVIVSTLVSLVPIEPGVKDLATVSAFRTVRLAFAAAVLAPAFVVVSAPAAIELLYVPGVALVV